MNARRICHAASIAPMHMLGAGCLALLLTVVAAHAAEPVRPAPPLGATLLDGQRFALDPAAGKVVIVNFWATWCAPCREEMPALDAFHRKYRGRGVEVLAISLDSARDLQAVRSALRGYGFAAAMSSQAEFEGYGRIWRVPTTFVIDRQGRLREDLTAGVTHLDLDWLERKIVPLLGP